MHSYQVFEKMVYSKKKGLHRKPETMLCSAPMHHIWKFLISLGKKNSSLRCFQNESGAPKERLESIINKHLMFTNPKLGIFLWLVDSLYLRTISWRDWKQKTNRIFWRTRVNCASRCFQKRCTKFIERVVGIRNGKEMFPNPNLRFFCYLWYSAPLYLKLVWNILEITPPPPRMFVLYRTPLNIPRDMTSYTNPIVHQKEPISPNASGKGFLHLEGKCLKIFVLSLSTKNGTAAY